MERKYQNIDNNQTDQNYVRARKKVELIRKFYKHLVIYVLVNIAISAVKVVDYMSDGFTFEEAFFQLDVFIVWIIWGVFVILQAIKTFKAGTILGADWEERKIQEIMNENKR